MKKVSYSALFVSLCFCFALAGCAEKNSEAIAYAPVQSYPTALSGAPVSLTEAPADALFQNPDYYAMPNLAKHTVEESGGTLKACFYFKNTATAAELNSARSFVISKFVLWKESKLGGTPYDEMIRANTKPPNVYCEIYLDDQLLLQDIYEGDILTVYENLSVPFKARNLNAEEFSPLTAIVKKQIPNAGIMLQKSLLGDCILITVETENPVTMVQLEQTKAQLSRKLFSKNSELLNAYGGVVLRFLLNGEEYTETYLNYPDSPGWVTDDWMNHSFAFQ